MCFPCLCLVIIEFGYFSQDESKSITVSPRSRKLREEMINAGIYCMSAAAGSAFGGLLPLLETNPTFISTSIKIIPMLLKKIVWPASLIYLTLKREAHQAAKTQRYLNPSRS